MSGIQRKRIMTIIGARPQIIKAAALSRAIREHFADEVEELIVHTGQHYDENMSDVFFKELGIPAPDVNLNVGSASHAVQTARIMEGVEKLLMAKNVDALVVYGDTNSTLAAALAAVKIAVPVIHIEAGLRSFNKAMPEEINRILCDHASTMLFCPTQTAIDNLRNEGFAIDQDGEISVDRPLVQLSGDLMYDNSIHFATLSDKQSTLLDDHSLTTDSFVLVTIHRNANTDDPERLTAILSALLEVQAKSGLHLVFPIHPRTAKMLQALPDQSLVEAFSNNAAVHLLPPAGFLDMIALEKNARLVITDSGGVQKEAYFFEKPCVILRPETEWVEIVQQGCARLADADKAAIVSAADDFLCTKQLEYPAIFGDGKAAVGMMNTVLKRLWKS